MPQITSWWKVSPTKTVIQLKNNDYMKRAAEALCMGKLVSFPTETVYGLGADAASENAVSSIFKAKGRPQDNPLIVHIGKKEQLDYFVAEIHEKARKLMDHFWPGPLTLILPHRDNLAPNVTAGLSTVGIRMPDHPVALAILQLADIPIAAPSANISGRPSPTQAKHVWEDLHGKIDILLDGGSASGGVESTIVDVTQEVPVVLRPGGITVEDIETVIGSVQVSFALGEGDVPRAPGMKYAHYAPRGEMFLIQGNGNKVFRYIREQAEQIQRMGKKVGILTTVENLDQFHGGIVLSCGKRAEPESIARELYTTLRRFDAHGVEIILSESFPEEGVFFAVMNRMKKAAGGNVIQV